MSLFPWTAFAVLVMVENAIEVEGLTKRFGSVLAVDRVSFQVPRGSVFGFLGPNGSGKTTTLGMLTGLIPADEGRARIAGHDVASDLTGALGAVGAMVEEPAFYPALSGRRNLEVVARLMHVPLDAVDGTLARVGLAGEASHRRYKGYSQGMRRRLGLAAALIAEPDVLILDEPTNGLDPAGQLEVRNLLHAFAAEGRTVLISSHILHEVQETCTHAAVLRKGRVVTQGKMSDLLSTGSADRFLIDVDDIERAIAIARAVSGVRDAAKGDDGRLVVTAPPALASELNRALVQAGLAVSGLSHEQRGLEERFREWTQTEGASP